MKSTISIFIATCTFSSPTIYFFGGGGGGVVGFGSGGVGGLFGSGGGGGGGGGALTYPIESRRPRFLLILTRTDFGMGTASSK